MVLPVGQQVSAAGLLKLVDAYSGSGMGAAVGPFGQLSVDIAGKAPTYSSGILAFTPQAAPHDFFTLTGSPLVVCALRIVEVWMGATAAAAMELQLVYNSAADTGGTSTAPACVPIDPNDVAASCATAAYTVAPTAGTLVGAIAVGRVAGPILAGAGALTPLTWQFGVSGEKAPKLYTAAQQIALNGNGAALPGGIAFSIRFTWTEKPIALIG